MAYQPPQLTIGFVPAHRGFFSPQLAARMRAEAIAAMERAGLRVVVPDESQTTVGCVQNRREAELCAALFREQRVQGIVIGAVNFGDEQSAAWTVRQARLNVPVLIFGCPEEETLTPTTPRRDSFCGLLSIGDALRQIGVRYTVARRPIVFPSDAAFAADLDWFTRICRVVNGVREARYGMVGARPDAFWTCRYDEKQLQRLGPTAVVLDLSEAMAGARAIADDDAELAQLVAATHGYADTSKIAAESVVRSARLELFLRRWRQEQGLDALAIQCWTSIQANYGVCSCTAMGRLGDEGVPCACESDILGALSMHACLLACGQPAALADWNNLHNEDDELVNLWHCGVFPRSYAKTAPTMGVQEIIASSGAARYEDSQGTVEFVSAPTPLTLCRVTQDPDEGGKVVIAEGDIEDNPAHTFGAYGWCRIPHLQRLYRDVLLRHFPHHVALSRGKAGAALWEAFGNYLGLRVYHAEQATPGVYTPWSPFAPT
jgi:L-fucose isomerase-like protein